MTEFQRRLEANIRESLRFAVGEVQDDAVAHMVAGVNAVLNHPCAPAPSQHVLGWRLIETAPTDGRDLILTHPDWNGDIMVGSFAFGKWRERPSPDGASMTPTHWMHIPPLTSAPAPEKHVPGRWLPIAQADKTINHVTEFTQIGLTLKNSDTFWVRDEDGRVYEAAWSEGNNGRDYWWDWEAESPVDPVEFMPHPLDPRWATTTEGSPG